MGFLNRLILFLFSVVALIVGIVGWMIFLGITSIEFIDSKVGILGWIGLGIVWLVGSFRLLILSFTSFSQKEPGSDAKLVAKGNNGEMVLTPDVIHSVTSHVLDEVKGIHNPVIQPFFQKGKMEITIQMDADSDQNLPELIKEIQKKVSDRLLSQTGVKPVGVIVEVGKIIPKIEESHKEKLVTPAENDSEIKEEK